MRIAIVGAGAIGGYLGTKLAAAGEQVTFIARGANLEAIRSKGMKLMLEDGSEVHASGARGCEKMSEAGPHDVVLLTGLVFFAWGEIYSLFPATCGDTFGSKFATANAGLLYTAKGTAALLVPLTSIVSVSTGGWHTIFVAASVMNFVAAFAALLLLKPLRAGMAKS